jgi:2-polyprenyl-3-methyl-5-hydroxy-6-metoxy-1,4-benzoquinol methylase
LLLIPRLMEQGQHIDPDDAPRPDPAGWSEDQKSAWHSPEMATLRECVCDQGKNSRDSVLGELAEYHRETVEESYRKCVEWETLSIAEWKAADRSTPEGVQNFYDTTTSWRYDLAWYAHLQATGHAFPQSIAVARFLRAKGVTGDLLDFGSGIGLNGQVFDRFGFKVTIADVSRSLLDYAIWRNLRHGADIRAIYLEEEPLPAAAYDVVTAYDTLVHVTDFDATAARLHGALKPDGWLIANFDTRAPDDATAWHLHDHELDLDRRVRKAGFVKRHVIGGYLGCYQRSEPNTAIHELRTFRDRATLPLEQVGMFSRRVRWPTPHRLTKAVRLFTHL